MTRLKFSTSVRKPCTSAGRSGLGALPSPPVSPPLLVIGAEGGSQLDCRPFNAEDEAAGWGAMVSGCRSLPEAIFRRSVWDAGGYSGRSAPEYM